MRMGIAAALLVVLVGAADARAEDDARVAWLAEHAVKVRSIDPQDEEFADLAPLKSILEGVRIVQLGEQTHGDGAAFLAKARLIRFLHRELGFDVLAFESGLYDCAQGWRNLLADPEGVKAADLGVFGIWTQSFEVRPTLDYLRAAAATKRPLELCGFDCQLTSGVARKGLLDDLRRVARSAAPPLVEGEASQPIARVLQVFLSDKPALTASEAKAGRLWLSQLRAGLEGVAAIEARERAYWIQLTKSLEAQIEGVHARTDRKSLAAEDNNIRDRAMAENLIWLAEQHYPERKIIVWAATFHLMRNAPLLKPVKGPVDYERTVPMGHLVAEHFGARCYTLGFSAYRGRGGVPWASSYALEPPPTGCFEDLCFRADLTNAIVDLRSPPPGAAWLHEDFVARPLGHSPMRGRWHDVVDGLFFQRDMTPSTREGYAPPEPDKPLLPDIEKRWAAIQGGLRQGNAWANKWTFDPDFEAWVESAQPTPEVLAAQEASVRAYLAKHRDDAELAWRGFALLATIAGARKDPKGALEALDAALKAFPEKDIPMVAKTGQFQHLVNRRALLQWTQTGKPPIAWAMGLVTKDRRLRAFYWPTWVERDAGIEGKLKSALRKAYRQRKKRFPEFADEIDETLQGM